MFCLLAEQVSACDLSFIAGSIPQMLDVQSVVADAPWDEAIVGPSFSSGQPDVVTASVGQTAYLTCRVRQLGDRKVSQSTTSNCAAFET